MVKKERESLKNSFFSPVKLLVFSSGLFKKPFMNYYASA